MATKSKFEPILSLTVPRKAFAEVVQIVAKAVSGRSTLQILSHLHIQAVDATQVALTGNDLELSISARIPAQVVGQGALTVPARTLQEVLANLPDKGDVTLGVDALNNVQVTCEKSAFKLLGLAAGDYPQLPAIETPLARFTIPQALLKQMIRQTAFAVGTDETRKILTGVLCRIAENTLHLVATDTHRLAVRSVPVASDGAASLILPVRAVNEVANQSGEGETQVTLTAGLVRFDIPGENALVIQTRVIEGNFPNYQRVIPEGGTKQLVFATQPTLRAAKRASIVAKEGAQRLVFTTEGADHLILSAESQTIGNAREEVDATYVGDAPIEMAFNARYFLDALAAIESESVTFDLSESLKPGVLRAVPAPDSPAQVGDYLAVLMPMQVVSP